MSDRVECHLFMWIMTNPRDGIGEDSQSSGAVYRNEEREGGSGDYTALLSPRNVTCREIALQQRQSSIESIAAQEGWSPIRKFVVEEI